MLRRVAPAAVLGGTILFVLTAHLSAGTKTVDKPMFNGNRLGWCANWGADCGEPAAAAWCIAQGFAGVASFVKAPGIGEKSPTRIIATGAICDAAGCDGFKEITCVKLDTVAPEAAAETAETPVVVPAAGPVEAAVTVPTPEVEPPPLPDPGTAVAGKPPAPPPEVIPVSETAAATAPSAPSPEAVSAPGTAAKPEPAVRVITPDDAPAMAAASAAPAMALPVSARATVDIDDPGPPPPDTILLAAAGAPPLRPVLRVFDAPTFNGRRLDWCRGWKDRCGKATADEFCKLNGFVEALSFAPDPKIGATEPTRQIASGLVCDHEGCDGFAEIACTK